MDDFDQDFHGKSNCRCGGNRELELEVESKDVTRLLQSHDKMSRDKELLLMNEQRKCFPEMGSTASRML